VNKARRVFTALINVLCKTCRVVANGMFYERGCQEKKLLLIWQPENFSDSQPRGIDYH
jgi:hypothetical protein